MSLAAQNRDSQVDLLLIYPIWVTHGGRGRLQRMLPPLGVLSMASYIESLNYKVKIIDLHAEALTPEQFRRRVRDMQPRFVGITVLSSHFVPAHHVAAICKEESPQCKVIVGGVHAEACPEAMLQNPAIDAVCRGDGEEVLREFIEGRTYSEIKGLTYRDSHSQIIQNERREVEMDLDKYPLPAYHLVNLNNYFPPVGTYRDYPAVNALMTRGCPGKCTFCNSARTTLRGRSPEAMVELIKHLRSKHGIRQIYFYDDTFTANPKTVRAFCEKLIAEKIDISFVCYARGDMFSDEMADLLSRAGCHHVLLGIESGSDTLMRQIGKPIDKAKYKRVVEIAHKYNIEVRGAFIIGHIDETHETLEETLQFAIDLDLDFFQPSILTPYPGTELFKQARKENILLHENYDRYGQGEVVLKMRHLQPKDIYRFYKMSFIRFYFRPKVVVRQILRLRNWWQLRDLVKAAVVIFLEHWQSRRTDDLRGWLHFDLNKIAISQIVPSQEPRLTYEIRQGEKKSKSLNDKAS